MQFGDILRELLEENNITQKKLASDLNLGVTTVGNYIRGLREPDFEILKAFAKYFHVTTDYLLNFQGDALRDHTEDKLLRLYRSLDFDQKILFLEQGKLLARMNQTKEGSFRSTFERKNNVG